MTQAVRHDAMRARNLALVLGEVGAREPITRAALSEITGLTKTTVSKLVADLIEAGLVVETGAVRDGERGRPGVAVRISGEHVAAVGLEINVDYLAVRVVDLSRSVRLRRTQAVDNRLARPEDVAARLREMALTAVDEAVDKGLRVVGGVVAVPGPVDLSTGTLRNAPNLGWRDVPVPSLLGLPFPVRVENEANLAALGELWFGPGPSDFLHVSGEIGVGAGLVVGGRLFRGTHGFAGELGHVVVSPDGPACRCGGSGCLEQYAGQDALLAAAGPSGHAPRCTRTTGSHPTAAAEPSGGAAQSTRATDSRPTAGGIASLVSRLEAGDPGALAACRRAGWALGVALSSAINLVDPGMIVLGGIYAPLFPWLGDHVAGTLASRLGGMRADVPPVVASRLGSEAAALGAAGQVIQRVIADPAASLKA
ncbi:ROK family transcriptional regulator [Planotetraspora sp. A-T 1434]|uniref:ROK family transcriptional regulator n=1 Tax=Planotetraspora sp. A-T 1434 TaxID=2979219 RepID=UPI0021C1BABF|nr:ROK family transcriptional regulator [Planotetraspora sp. A-T 1434]MCT9934839.1 ROK family transcriptional regulator [Planotetraspora sp. A-T 1434]